MTFKTTKLREAISFALVAGVAGTGAAYAQDTTSDTATTTLDRIEVTGSRIKRTDIETSQPVFSLSREDIQAQGLTSVGDVIQNITANGSTLNSTQNNGGNGETRVSLRNLGSVRTLVLVNGRRWVGGTGLGGAVDLNTIPTAAVERIEVLKDGASTIYGSDAIAGVVNVILRQNFDGAEANAYIGQFDKGDGYREAYDFTVGAVNDRWSAMFGVGYVKEDPVRAGDREISAEPVAGTGAAFGSSTSPNGRFGFGAAPCTTASGGTAAAGNQLPGPGCRTGTVTRDGQTGGLTAGAFRTRTGADAFNFAPLNYLLTPQERRSLFASGSLEITDNVRFKVTSTYNERLSEQLLAANPIVLGTVAPGTNGGNIAISRDSIYNPFGQDVTRIQRRAVETGGRSFNQDVVTYVFNGAFEGTFDVGDKFFDWEAGYTYGQNKANNRTDGLFNISALRNGLGPSFRDAQGVARCGTPTAVIDRCVPVNLLGGVGTFAPDQLAYAGFVANDELLYRQKNYYANVGGDLFEMPGGAGPLAFSLGAEHRTEFGYDQPDALIALGDTTGNARSPTSGGYSLDEAYIELAIPVLKDIPGAKLLDFSVATRYSDYSNFGNTLNSKFGFRWKPIDDLLVRGNYSEGFRAPSVNELFSGQSDSFPQLTDACNTTSFPSLTPDAQARCIGQGVPAGGYAQTNTQIRITVGGNPNLQPETSTSKTLGLVYSPSWLQGFDISLDWYRIELESAITTFGGATIINNCIVENIPSFCPLFTRDGSGQITNLLAAGTNIGGTNVEGYDLTVGYRLPENAFGKFSFVWDTTYLSTFENDSDGDGKFGEVSEGGNLAGEYSDRNNNWRIRSNVASRWEKGDFGATWNVRYYSAQDENCQNFVDYGYSFLCSDPNRFTDNQAGESTPSAENHIGATTYHDFSVYFNAPWNAKVTLGLNNAFDKDPPRSVSTFANSFDPQYEVPGRFYYMRYAQKF